MKGVCVKCVCVCVCQKGGGGGRGGRRRAVEGKRQNGEQCTQKPRNLPKLKSSDPHPLVSFHISLALSGKYCRKEKHKD